MVKPDATHQDAARGLLDDLRLTPAETDSRYAQAIARGYWRTLVPTLTCGDTGTNVAPATAIDAEALADLAGRFAEEGYFKLPPMFPSSLIEGMRAAVTTVQEAGWPPVFAWVYDEFWRVPRSQPVVDLLSSVLGSGYRQAPGVWTHVVQAHRGAAGWVPHVDHLGRGTRLTVWIPLSDATVDTGCICLLPRHLVPRRLAGHWYDTPTVDMKEAIQLIHAARPLPAAAGAVLGWSADLLHWGAAREVSGDPRISYSMEFAAADAELDADEQMIDASQGTLPSFEDRLRTIAQGIVLYRESDLRGARHLPLAERLLAPPNRG